MGDFAFQEISFYIDAALKILNPSDFEDFFFFTVPIGDQAKGHVAKLVDALDLGSNGATRGGSTPSVPTA